LAYVIAQPCIDCKDKSCVEQCPTDCIYEGERMFYIHPDECVDCGACEVCPVDAVFPEEAVPEQWTRYISANVDFFAELGSPGGATAVGLVAADPQWIKDMPPARS
jgi:NAD-dependent dihydropyrimidine dehydrogenase PreA subunit